MTHPTAGSRVPSPLRVLFVALEYDYGRRERGRSFEYVNFFETLRRMGNVSAELFAFDEEMRVRGREGMNNVLVETVNELSPDLCFFFLFTDEITKETIRRVGMRTTTVNWFADDHWRFEGYSRFWAPLFHHVVTTDAAAVEKYRRSGVTGVIHSQWGFNDAVYKPVEAAREFDVTFVGQVHSNRSSFVSGLARSGVAVRCWGKGWPAGRLPQEEMVAIYSRSRINLNFTESSAGFEWKSVLKALVNRRADDSYHLRPATEIAGHLRSSMSPRTVQIKGRNFEIPGAGGFLLTQHAPEIGEYFVPGKEIATFRTDEELLENIRHFLSHDDEREAIRAAGEKRALADHTYRKRFYDLFARIFPGRIA